MRITSWLRPLVARPNRNPVRRTSKRPTFCPRIETLEDRTAPAIFTVTNVDDSGAGSLRQAILDANATPGADSIAFALADTLKAPDGDWWTIQPPTSLPALTDTVLVDGWSQGGAGYHGEPRVLLDGGGTAVSGDGLQIAADGCTIRGLAIRNFTGASGRHGIRITGGDATIQGCYLGLDPSGNKTAFGNDAGIWNSGLHAMIGGANPGEGNVISGNGDGIDSDGAAAVIRGNRVGTNPAGTDAIPNAVAGIYVVGPSALTPAIVGGSGRGEGNLISGNGDYIDYGIGVGSNVRVLGNLIGTDVTGMQALGNSVTGISIAGGASNVVIGGTDAGSRNVISANLNGIEGSDAADYGILVQGNYIGTDVNGAPTLGNRREGIGASSNWLIGGTEAGAGNLIAGNFDGVGLYGSNNLLIGNVIAESRDAGVGSEGVNNQFIGNVIHDNRGAGIQINGKIQEVRPSYAEGNTVSANAIYANGGLGIDLQLADPINIGGVIMGVTLNDSAGHDGPNHFQNFPDLAGVTRTVGGTTVTGTLTQSVTPSTSFRVEFFANTGPGNLGPDGFLYGQGERYLGSVDVTSDANGVAPITASLPALLAGEQFVTATATNLATGDTSEFSQAIASPAKADQTILPNWPVRAPGTSSVTLNLTSSSGLPVSYTVSGPATFNPATNVLTITGLSPVTVTASQAGDDHFNAAADISTSYAVAPASLSGVVFKDFNEDGFLDYGELGAAGVAVQLTGTDFNGTPVSPPAATTGASGYFQFANLLPGTYTVSIPNSLTVTKVTVGLNGSDPTVVGNGHSATGLAIVEATTLNFVNFGLEPAAGDALHKGETAGIGFWNNKNGQALIKLLNAGTGTQLGGWLAATFTHMFGTAGHDLTGSTNATVAAYFQTLFATKGDKLEAQVLATALSVYVTNSTLAGGTYAASYGFTVVAGGGTGLATFNVGADGAAVGQAAGTNMTIMDILLAVDQHATQSTTAAGFVLYSGDQASRNLADDLFGRINDLGGIS